MASKWEYAASLKVSILGLNFKLQGSEFHSFISWMETPFSYLEVFGVGILNTDEGAEVCVLPERLISALNNGKKVIRYNGLH